MTKIANKYRIDEMDADTKKELSRLMLMHGMANGIFCALFVTLTACAVRNHETMGTILCGAPALFIARNTVNSLRAANKISRDLRRQKNVSCKTR